jgi:hypothetical protein
MARLGTAHVAPTHKLDTEDKEADSTGRQKMLHWVRQWLCLWQEALQEQL